MNCLWNMNKSQNQNVFLGRMEKPESGIRNRSRKRNRNWNRNLNWDRGELGSTETSSRYPDTRVEIKFKMASSVIIFLRNFQHNDRDTKDIITFGKWLPTKKNITTQIQRISPCCSAADSSINSSTTTSHFHTYSHFNRFVALSRSVNENRYVFVKW